MSGANISSRDLAVCLARQKIDLSGSWLNKRKIKRVESLMRLCFHVDVVYLSAEDAWVLPECNIYADKEKK